MTSSEAFELRASDAGGRRVRQHVVRCSKCPKTGSVTDAGRTALPPDPVAKKFRRLGWHIAPRRGKDLCPACNRGTTSKTLSPAQRRAAYCRIAGVPKAKEKPMTSPPRIAAEPPREPTVLNRRTIMDALEAHYDVPAQRYRAAFTDAALAEQLKMPRAWISDLRDLMCGPEANEAAAQRQDEIATLIVKAQDLERRALDLGTEAEQLRGALRRLLK